MPARLTQKERVEIRMRCLELATSHFDAKKEAVDRATAYEEFVLGKPEELTRRKPLRRLRR